MHEKHCDGKGSKLDHKKVSASWTCPKCNNHIHSQRERHTELCDGMGAGAGKRHNKRMRLRKGRNWAKGASLCSDHREKISNSLLGRKWSCSNEISRRKKISDTMKKNSMSGGYRVGSGRCKGLWYESPIAGKVYLDSSYEHRLAVVLDSLCIMWKKNNKKFPYIDETGKKRNYIPDFFLEEKNLWIEVKGFQTDRDLCK